VRKIYPFGRLDFTTENTEDTEKKTKMNLKFSELSVYSVVKKCFFSGFVGLILTLTPVVI
jgi:hypothetical protein